ncbi:MAG: hypothetical protein GX621_06065 [Pirellulaceae bacterium]|nr:hypothetical protein [Pirellulaceae bacterium]
MTCPPATRLPSRLISLGKYRPLPCLLLTLSIFCGCHSSPWSSQKTVLGLPAPGGALANAANPPSPTVSPDEFRTDEAELRRVMAEARQIGADNPTLAAPLLAELQASDPSLWPLVVESYRARLAYGEQLREREALASRHPHRPPHVEGPAPSVADSSAQSDPMSPWTEPRVARLPTADSTLLVRTPEAMVLDGSTGTASGYPIDYPHPSWPFDAGSPLPINNNSPPPPTSVPAQSAPSTSPPAGGNQVGEGIIRASHESPIDNRPNVTTGEDWQTLLDEAIRRLDARLNAASPADSSVVAQRARLELLRLAAGRSEAASSSPSESDPWTARFWASEAALLRTLLEGDGAELSDERLGEAHRHLRRAADSLAEASPLAVHNPAFCRAIDGFGSIKRFETYAFRPGQRVLLYAEVENFRAEPTPRGYHTSLESRYTIVDRAGKQIDRNEAIATEEYCANQRRDFFLGCDFRLPRQIRPGPYTLVLAVEDQKTGKTAETKIEFTIE